jgi:hypothetical protein
MVAGDAGAYGTESRDDTTTEIWTSAGSELPSPL